MYIDDATSAIIASMRKGVPNNTYIISADEAPTVREYIELGALYCGRQVSGNAKLIV